MKDHDWFFYLIAGVVTSGLLGISKKTGDIREALERGIVVQCEQPETIDVNSHQAEHPIYDPLSQNARGKYQSTPDLEPEARSVSERLELSDLVVTRFSWSVPLEVEYLTLSPHALTPTDFQQSVSGELYRDDLSLLIIVRNRLRQNPQPGLIIENGHSTLPPDFLQSSIAHSASHTRRTSL
tara:strand:+ start:18099 stop:18644 length:546 start_codon:yes stop_codon:yes gene_type:complete